MAVEADIDEVRRHGPPHGKIRRVREAARDARVDEAPADLVVEPARVTHLEGVAGVVPGPERPQEIIEAREVLRERSRQLPHDARELVTEAARLISQQADRVIALRETTKVRYVPVTFDGESKRRRRLARPLSVRARAICR